MQDSSPKEPLNRQASSGSLQPPSPPKDAIFTNIMWLMIANVMVGAVLVIIGETMKLPPAVAHVGLGLALISGGVYFFFRWFQRKEARRREQQWEAAQTDADSNRNDRH